METKLLPSLQFSSEKNLGAQSTEAKSSQPNPMTVFESLIGEEKVKKFEQRFEEKYDLESDELYSVWLKMKTLTIHDKPSVTDTTLSSTDTLSDPLAAQSNTTQQSDLCIPSKSVLDDILVYPSVQQSKKSTSKSTSTLPKHLSSEQFIQYLQKLEKEKAEEEKVR